MAFINARNKDQRMIREGRVDVVTVTDPQLISPDSNPMDSITIVGPMGFIMRGTIDVGLDKEYADLESDTPALLVASDLIRQAFTLRCDIIQWNINLFGLVWGLEIEDGQYPMAKIGHATPILERYGYLVRTTRLDGTPFNILMFEGFAKAESTRFAPSGDSHVTYSFMAQATQPEAIEALDVGNNAGAYDNIDYGVMWFSDAGGSGSGS